MKIFRIKNRTKKGFIKHQFKIQHTQLYIRTRNRYSEDLGIFDNNYYDRCTETIAASREAKIRYIFSNIFRSE